MVDEHETTNGASISREESERTTESGADERSGPLKDLRVLDLGMLVQGPQAAGMLGDFGAEVIKLEIPEIGDGSRWVPLSETDRRSAMFFVCNRGKRSMTLDLRIEAGREVDQSLEPFFFHGSGLGGARPKTLIDHEDRSWIAKFNRESDLVDMCKVEFATMQMAQTTLRSVVGQAELDDLLSDRERINQQLQRIIDGINDMGEHITRIAKQHGQDLLEAHQRVRRASKQAQKGISVEPHLPADVLGVFVYLPVPKGGAR